MTLTDRRGLALSTANRASLDGYESALELLNGWYLDFLGSIDAVLGADPGFVMGHCFRAAVYATACEAGARPELARSLEAGEALAGGANERERAHLAALRAWHDGDLERAAGLYARITREWPRDLLALQVGHQADFLLGDARMLRDRVAQVLPHWDAAVPGYGYVLGMHAFGLEQTNLYARAEAAGVEALALNRRDPWAIHAVAHVLEMQGRVEEGVRWLTTRRADWAENNALAYHNWWHLALYHLDRGEVERVLQIYDGHIRPGAAPTAMEMVDASAMLWRLHLRGVDVGPRWTPVAAAWSQLAADGYYAFNDVHACMAFVGAGDHAALARTLAALEARAVAGAGAIAGARSGETGYVAAGHGAMQAVEGGLALAQAIAAFGAGRHAECAERLLSVRARAHRCGGSHAQRDVYDLTLLEAAMRAGDRALARALAAERAAARPHSENNRALLGRVLASGERRTAA